MTSLGFENYAEALKIYLSKYREVRFAKLFLFRPASLSGRVLRQTCDQMLTDFLRLNPQGETTRIDRRAATVLVVDL